MLSLPKKSQRCINNLETFLKWLIGLLAFGFIFYKIYTQIESGGLEVLSLVMHKPTTWIFLLISIVGVWINWGLESLKWKMLVSVFQRLDFKTAYKSVLAGVTVSILTPNRIGEFAGRILFLRPQCRLRGALASLAGSLAQLVSTLLFGLIGVGYLLIFENGKIPLLGYVPQPNLIFTGICILFIITLIVFYQLKNLASIFKNKKLTSFLRVYKSYDSQKLTKIFFLSNLRFLVFCLQYHFLILIFFIPESHLLFLMLIFVAFLITTIIPTVALSELTTRTSVVIILFEPFGVDAISISVVSLLLWILNLGFTSLIGILFLQEADWFGNSKKN